jgi:hypothetical protein
MGITDKKQPYLVGIMLKPQHNVIADNSRAGAVISHNQHLIALALC